MEKQDTSGITIYSTVWCPDCKRAKRFFAEHRVSYTNVDIEQEPEGMAFVEKANQGRHIIPTIIFSDGSILTEPSNAELAAKMSFKQKVHQACYDVIIIGSGPTGLTSALYLARAGLDVLVIEKSGLGGQISITQALDNFPGFPQGISGAEFSDRLVEQAKSFGVEILEAQEVTGLHQVGSYHCINTADGSEYTGRAVLLATGARYRKLGVPGEDELIGTNIHFCATCDGAFYKGKKVLVVGGGNSGFEEGLFLTKFAVQVDILERSAQSKASKILQEKVDAKTNMHVLTNRAIQSFKGSPKLESILVEDRFTGELEELIYDGVFVFIGMTPNNDLVKKFVSTDPQGFILTDASLMTAIPGLFAAGDVRSGVDKASSLCGW